MDPSFHGVSFAPLCFWQTETPGSTSWALLVEHHGLSPTLSSSPERHMSLAASRWHLNRKGERPTSAEAHVPPNRGKTAGASCAQVWRPTWPASAVSRRKLLSSFHSTDGCLWKYLYTVWFWLHREKNSYLECNLDGNISLPLPLIWQLILLRYYHQCAIHKLTFITGT